jgi:hypothetical protein
MVSLADYNTNLPWKLPPLEAVDGIPGTEVFVKTGIAWYHWPRMSGTNDMRGWRGLMVLVSQL